MDLNFFDNDIFLANFLCKPEYKSVMKILEI